MKKYSYTAINNKGKTIKGSMIANNPDELKANILKSGLYLMSCTEASDSSKPKKRLDYKNLLILCNQLASMLKAGLSIATTLQLLHDRLDNPKLKKILAVMYETVQKGNSLADAVAELGNTFPPIMLSMVKSGEMSGELDTTMEKLAKQFESEQRLRNKVKSAMNYPMIVGGLAFVVVILMVVFVIPKMATNFGELPAITQFFLDMADFFKNVTNDIIIAVAIVFIIVVFRIMKTIPSVKYKMDKLKVKIPKLGDLVTMVYTARFARGLATLYDNGIELITAIDMSTHLINNTYIEDRMLEAMERIKKGESIATAISSINVFNKLLVSMLYVGEESGDLGSMLNQTADFFDEESNTAIDKLVGMINPAMMIIMAGVVGVIMLAVMSPIFSMYNQSYDRFLPIKTILAMMRCLK